MSFERAQNVTFIPNCWINTVVCAGNFVAPTVFETSLREAWCNVGDQYAVHFTRSVRKLYATCVHTVLSECCGLLGGVGGTPPLVGINVGRKVWNCYNAGSFWLFALLTGVQNPAVTCLICISPWKWNDAVLCTSFSTLSGAPWALLIQTWAQTSQSFSSERVFVSSSLVRRHTCLAAFSNALGDLPLKRSRLGKK